MSNYSVLPSRDLPSLPPAYDFPGESSQRSPPIEQFEINEDEVYEPLKRDSLFSRLRFFAAKASLAFKEKVVAPLIHILNPLFAAMSFVNSRYEQGILKIGNPLVVKRLFYVFFFVGVMYILLMSQPQDGVNGASGGAFSTGKFYDVTRLGGSLQLYIEAKSLKENIEYLSSMPHLAGSMGDLTLARYVESFFSNNGIEVVDFHEMNSFLNFPKSLGTYVKMSDNLLEATLHEGSSEDLQYLAFNPNSPGSKGEIEAPFVFVNFGSLEDFQKLKDANVEVSGCILFIKYGGSLPEANKVAEAHRLGAKAVVFISRSVNWADHTHDDMIQKINVGLTRYSPGDILTPGWSSHDPFVARLDWDKSPATAKIPCVPVSWKDGMAFVKKLGSNGVDFGHGLFSGILAEKVKLRVSHEERSTHLIWNVVGSIPGREQASKGIIFGAPRDSVCYGASGSASSTAVLLELAKAFTSLQRRYSWSPSRSIYFVSFDATEYNLAGSTEWIEDKKRQLLEEGYAYIEVSDVHLGDILDVVANPLLHSVIETEMKNVKVSEGKSTKSLFDIYKEQHDGKVEFSNELVEDKNYVPFVNILNIPSMHVGFKPKTGVVPDHSCVDTFSALEKQLDLSMDHQKHILELLARVGLRLAEEPLIPFNFNDLVSKLSTYREDVMRYVEATIAAIPSDVTPLIKYDSLKRGIDRLGDGARMIEQFRKDWIEFITNSASLEPVMLAATRRTANDKMIAFNNLFLGEGKTPLRAGYLNFLFGLPQNAPPTPDGEYEWNTFPMVREYAARGDYGRVQFEINRIAQLLASSAELLMRLS